MLMSVSASEKSFAQGQVTINGAGATFPFPLIDTGHVAYQKDHPNVNINYQSIGSGGGVKQFTAKIVDFSASDAPLNAYPIASFSYLLLYKNLSSNPSLDETKAKALVDFIINY